MRPPPRLKYIPYTYMDPFGSSSANNGNRNRDGPSRHGNRSIVTVMRSAKA